MRVARGEEEDRYQSKSKTKRRFDGDMVSMGVWVSIVLRGRESGVCALICERSYREAERKGELSLSFVVIEKERRGKEEVKRSGEKRMRIEDGEL